MDLTIHLLPSVPQGPELDPGVACDPARVTEFFHLEISFAVLDLRS